MDEYKFSPYESEILVKAISEGYKEYIKHRIEHHNNVKDNAALTSNRARFIENKIAENSDKINLIYRKSRAGLNWNYLQFIHKDKQTLFLVMNAAYLNERRFSQELLPDTKRKGTPRTYLHELSKINEGLRFMGGESAPERLVESTEQLALFQSEQLAFDEIEDFSKAFNEFHIVTYKIDGAFQMTEVKHYLPNPENNKAYFIEDLSHYISRAELTNEEREILELEQESNTANSEMMTIGIFEEE